MDSSSFDYQPRTRLVFGNGTLRMLGELTAELGGSRTLVVSDPGIVAAGYAARAVESLNKAGVNARVYGDVRENPSTEDVLACVGAAVELGADFIVGLGGGSSMDTAKGCNFILTNGGRMQDYWGVGKATREMLPMICVPTTAGTGSECQSFALISDAETHVKMACGDPKAAARAAILDPELTLSQPNRVTACTGIDAMAHAIETAVTTRRTPLSSMFSREAFRLIHEGFERVLRNPGDLESRGLMLLGAAYAGTAIENSMLGAAHSCANPLTACLKVVHGEAVGVMLPHVVRYNSQDAKIASIYRGLFPGDLAQRVEELLAIAGLPQRLKSFAMSEADIEGLAAMAKAQWTAQFNPVGLDEEGFAGLYRQAF